MKSMYAPDCGSTGACEISWFHQWLDGNSARPPKSSLSLTVLRPGTVGAGLGSGSGVGAGVGVGAGAGAGDGDGDGDGAGAEGGGSGSAAGVADSLGAAGVGDGARGINGCSLPHPDIRATVTESAAAKIKLRGEGTLGKRNACASKNTGNFSMLLVLTINPANNFGSAATVSSVAHGR
jgi:hypothetical protein